MPKKPLTINQFHGGLNNNSSSRDIADDELTAARDIVVEHLGKIALMGGPADYASVADLSGTLAVPIDSNSKGRGYGLFNFAHDYDGMEDIGADETYSGTPNLASTEYTLFVNNSNSNIYIHSNAATNGGWGSNTLTLNIPGQSTAANPQPSFSVADGIIRVCDGNFSNTLVQNKSIGHYNRKWWTKFSNVSYNKWYTFTDKKIQPPISTGAINDDDNAGKTFVKATGSNSGPYRDGQVIWILQEGSADGNWNFYESDDNAEGDNYQFYVSYIYDGGYDGPLATHDDWKVENMPILDDDGKRLLINVDVCFSSAGSWSEGKAADWFTHHPPNVIGQRLWFADIGGGFNAIEEIYALAEIYFDENDKGGLRKPLAATSSKWKQLAVSSGGSYNWKFTAGIAFISPPQVFTYEDINGYEHDEDTSAKYKSVVIANRKMYVGNVFLGGKAYGDMMIKSPVNGFGIFPKSRSIGASVNDGDEIVKLEAYADRILQFKRGKMHLINISQEVEFLEETFAFKGIEHPCQTCATDFGIAWVNAHGVYLYDGKQVRNLFEKQGQGRKLISESEWDTFYGNSDDTVSIGYLPQKRQIIILDSVGHQANKNVYLYDLTTGSWVQGENTLKIGSDIDKIYTNFIPTGNGNLAWAYYDSTDTDIKFKKFSTDSVSHDHVRIGTKSLDFGSPVQKTKIYSVYVTHKNAGAGNKVALYGDFHSSPDGEVSNQFKFGYLTQDSGSAGSFICERFDPPSLDMDGNSISFNSVYTLRLYISSREGSETARDVPSGFEINDITVVYRLKSVK